jgi:hypothetical protein
MLCRIVTDGASSHSSDTGVIFCERMAGSAGALGVKSLFASEDFRMTSDQQWTRVIAGGKT